MDPAFPTHYFLLGADKYGLTQLQNLDQLPSTGALVIASPLPIVGDPLYGGPLRLPKGASDDLVAVLRGFRRQALHAETLEFAHPVSGEPVRVTAPVPADMVALLAALRADTQAQRK